MAKNSSATGLGGRAYDTFNNRRAVGMEPSLKIGASKAGSGQVFDSFTSKAPSRTALLQYATKARSSVSPLMAPASTAGARLRQTAQSVHRGAQRSKTLMRSGLAKPTAKKSQSLAAHTEASRLKNSSASVNPMRAARAKNVSKNIRVQRFGGQRAAVNGGLPKSKNLSVVGEVLPSRTNVSAASATATTRPLPSMITSVSHHQIERLLDQALFRADAHRRALRGQLPGQSRLRRLVARPKRLTIGSTLLVILLLAGFFAWQNIPQVSMRIAASQAHVDASVPSYTPAGFSFRGPISHTSDTVKISFKANTDTSRTFAITQKSSNEDSSSLAANNLPASSAVQTSQINGTTVYIYGDKNNATWVNHGVRYTIDDKASLNSDQILKIADSL